MKGEMIYKLIGKIIEIKGKCSAGHKVGDEIELTIFDGDKSSVGIKLCPFFLHDLFPYLCVMQFGGQFPWESDSNVFMRSCPDVKNSVTIRIKRIKTNNGG